MLYFQSCGQSSKIRIFYSICQTSFFFLASFLKSTIFHSDLTIGFSCNGQEVTELRKSTEFLFFTFLRSLSLVGIKIYPKSGSVTSYKLVWSYYKGHIFQVTILGEGISYLQGFFFPLKLVPLDLSATCTANG